jgi:subtilisin family serine protease
VDLDHPDLVGKIAGGATFVSCPDRDNGCGDGDVDSGERRDGDGHPHGTHVAGIVAAATDNGVGLAGVAPDARILAVKSLNGDGEGSFDEVAAGVRWATANGADVINLSLGALPGAQALTLLGDEDPLVAAIDAAIAAGVVVVAAAGNEFASICAEPAFSSGALCVSATDRFESRSPFSNFPIDPDMHVVSAPGGSALLSCQDDIVSTVPEGTGDICTEIEGTPGYDFYAGTSMAAPHVAGIAALLTGLGLDNIAAVETLERTARTPVTDARGSYTPLYGFGIVDATAAVADAAGAEPTEEPTAEPTEEPTAEPTEEPTEDPSPRPTRTPREPPRGPRSR